MDDGTTSTEAELVRQNPTIVSLSDGSLDQDFQLIEELLTQLVSDMLQKENTKNVVARTLEEVKHKI